MNLREAAVLSVGLASGGWMDGRHRRWDWNPRKVAGVRWDALDLTLLVHILEEDETLPYL